MRTIVLVFAALLLCSRQVFAAPVKCVLKLIDADTDGVCNAFQKEPYIPLFNSWNVQFGCDEIHMTIDSDRAKLSFAPFYRGLQSGRTTSTQSRVFVVSAGARTVINYNPGSRNTISPILIVLAEDRRMAEFHWMYQHNGDSKFGPFPLECRDE